MTAPGYAGALAACRSGDAAECQRITADLLRARPDDGPASLLRGVTVPEGEAARRFALLKAACRRQPGHAEHWAHLAEWHECHGEPVEAARCWRRAVSLDPAHVPTLLRATESLRITEHFTEALPLARRLQRLLPDDFIGYAHEAISLQQMGTFEAADRVFAEAIRRRSNPALLHWEHHFSLLARERFAEAWDSYEWRFDCDGANSVDDMAFDLPRWTGGPAGHVLVYGEQGIGDQLMFANALDEVIARVDRVSLAVAPHLVALFQASFPQVHVLPIVLKRDPATCAALVAEAGRVHPVDASVPLGSLMALFRRRREAFTGRPYLRASDAARAYWAARAPVVRQGDRPLRVGLCWACNPCAGQFGLSRRAQRRTMDVAQVQRLAGLPGVEAVAVTNVPLAAFGVEGAASLGIADVSASLTTLDRTAALIETLDLLVTVDTGVAHLAGALGKPVWLMLHDRGDPRWGRPGARTSYWYESAELFWQETPGDWDGLVDRIADRLVACRAQLPAAPVREMAA